METSPLTGAERLLQIELVKMSLLLVNPALDTKPGFSIAFRVLVKLSGGKNAGKEKPAAAAACNDCNRAAECSCALRRSSATDVDRGSFADDVVTLAGERFALNDEIDDVVDDVIVGQHEHKPGNPECNHIFIEFSNQGLRKCQHFYDDLLTIIR